MRNPLLIILFFPTHSLCRLPDVPIKPAYKLSFPAKVPAVEQDPLATKFSFMYDAGLVECAYSPPVEHLAPEKIDIKPALLALEALTCLYKTIGWWVKNKK